MNPNLLRIMLPAALRGMAAAIRKGDISNFPTPFNVIAVLEYAAKVIANNALVLVPKMLQSV